MDTVILAAGRGSRLRGVAAPFHKPFMVVDGRALVVGATSVALEVASPLEQDRVFIIAAPGNVVPLVELTRESLEPDRFARLRFIVQPEPYGPGHAFLLVAEVDTSPEVLVLLADNVLHVPDVARVVHSPHEYGSPVVGYRDEFERDVATRFTRVAPDLSVVEDREPDSTQRWGNEAFRVWVGPLVVPRREFDAVLRNVHEPGELKLGRHLGKLPLPPTLVSVESYDVGEPAVVEDV